MSTSSYKPWDVNRAYEHIAERLKLIDGVKAVRGKNDLAQILGGKTGSDGYVYLIYDGYSFKAKSGSNQISGFSQLLKQTYSVIVSSQTYSDEGMPKGTGELIGAVICSLSGFSPVDKDKRSREVLVLTDAGKPIHSYGRSLYPIKFEIDLFIKGYSIS